MQQIRLGCDPQVHDLYGSSGNSGTRRANLEEEVGIVAIPVGDALEYFDLVVAALEYAGVDRIAAVTQDAVEMALQHRGKFAERRNTTAERATWPRVPEPEGGDGRSILPQALEVVLEHLRDEERAVGAEQVAQAHALTTRFDIRFVPEQQIADAAPSVASVGAAHDDALAER